MTNEERERWRYTFAGQAMQGMHWKDQPVQAVQFADALIAELERTAPNRDCKHHSTHIGEDGTLTCTACGFEI